MVPYVQLSTNCGLDNYITVQILFLLYHKPILQSVDKNTYGTIDYRCIKKKGKKCNKQTLSIKEITERGRGRQKGGNLQQEVVRNGSPIIRS